MIWTFKKKYFRRLFYLGILNIPIGAILFLFGVPFWRSFGAQAFVFGAIEAVIALYGLSRFARFSSEERTPEGERRQSDRVSRELWIGTGLSVMLIAAGLILLLSLRTSDPGWRGHGWGIILQGSFLFLINWQHGLRVPPGPQPDLSDIFPESEHSSYLWKADKPAALLVHGFPGTPNELRPLSEALFEAGWTVHGLLLPGFGPEFADLGKMGCRDWTESIREALCALQREHSPVVLVGYSMGGALSIKVASDLKPDSLILMAPFIWPDSALQRILMPVLPFLLPSVIRPLKWVIFTNPHVQARVNKLIEVAEGVNPDIHSSLNAFVFPLTMLYEVRKAGVEAAAVLDKIDVPTLVIQGRLDRTVRPSRTRKFLSVFPARPAYVEVEAEHNLFDTSSQGWDDIREAVLNFVERLNLEYK